MKSRWFIFFSLLALLFIYTGWNLQRLWPRHPVFSWTLDIFVFVLIFAPHFAYHAKPVAFDRFSERAVAWTAGIAMGLWAAFILFSLPLDLAHGVWWRAENFPRMLPGLVVALSCGVAGFGLGEALAGPKVVDVAVPLPDLPTALEGLRIALISDLHVGPMIGQAYVERVVQRVNALAPDLIAVTGDLADGTVEALSFLVRPLERLKAPLGTYYVTGNHEYYWNAERWIQKAAALGFIPLINENRVVEVKGAKLLIGGVTDTSAHHFIAAHRSDPKRAVASTERAEFKLLLAHRPDSCIEAEAAGFDLQLSGHTHAGQFFPVSLLIPLFQRYYRGLNRRGRLWLYVTAGTGYWGAPNRFLVPAEITLLRLRKMELVDGEKIWKDAPDSIKASEGRISNGQKT